MRAVATSLPGVELIELEPRRDARGLFVRTFCRDRLAELGLGIDVAQANLSVSEARGTLRGLHYQLEPSAETKLVMCLAGAIWDCALDLRPGRPSFGRWYATELAADTLRLLVVPPGCAHGFLTLTDDARVLYLVSAPYDPARERGVRWDDPRFAIRWPFPPTRLSDRDRAHPDFDPRWHLAA